MMLIFPPLSQPTRSTFGGRQRAGASCEPGSRDPTCGRSRYSLPMNVRRGLFGCSAWFGREIPHGGACSDPKVGRGSVLGASEIGALGLEAFGARLAARPAAFEREPHRTLCGAGPSANRRRRGSWHTRAACTHSRRIRSRSRRDGALVFEQSVAADKHPWSPASRLPPGLAAERERSPQNSDCSRPRTRTRRLYFKGGVADLSWQADNEPLRCLAACCLLCPRPTAAARSLRRQPSRREGLAGCSRANDLLPDALALIRPTPPYRSPHG